MSAIPSKIELCDKCKTAVHHRGGPFVKTFQLEHADSRREPIRLCLGCFFGYKPGYFSEGWRIVGDAINKKTPCNTSNKQSPHSPA